MPRYRYRSSESSSAVASPALLVIGLATGLAIGVVGWGMLHNRHRNSLFHHSPIRRLAALGYLRAHPSVDSARLLRDYLQWEKLPLLRRRARTVLRRTEHLLRS